MHPDSFPDLLTIKKLNPLKQKRINVHKISQTIDIQERPVGNK